MCKSDLLLISPECIDDCFTFSELGQVITHPPSASQHPVSSPEHIELPDVIWVTLVRNSGAFIEQVPSGRFNKPISDPPVRSASSGGKDEGVISLDH